MSAYLKFFELEKSPFDTKAQSNLVLGTQALRTAFTEIEAGLADGAPRICVDGKEGLGKTSLARALPKLLAESAKVVLILNPSLPWSTLRSAIVKQLDLAEGNLSRKTLLRARAEGRRLVIAVDQAERISSESLDHLDILLGYNSDEDEQLVHCVLLANLQAATLQHNAQGEQTPLLWWLDKLNTLQLEFNPIPATGVTSYVQKHLKRAGWKGGQIFTPDALQTIHRLTGGVPRAVSDLCERALKLAGEEQTQRIDAGLVEDVFGEVPLDESIEDRDITDTAFIGAKDDDAESSTTTFGGGVSATSPRTRSGESIDEPKAPRPAAIERQDDDPRIDRMPSPGRRVHAPVDAPVSLDSFFGDSHSAASTPEADSSAGPKSAVGNEESTDAFSLDRDADAHSHVPTDEADEAGFAPSEPSKRRGLKWVAAGVAIAAGLAIVAGGGLATYFFFTGMDADGGAEPSVIARPKSTPVPNPIAGIESVPRTTDGLALDGIAVTDPDQRDVLDDGTDGVASAAMLDSLADKTVEPVTSVPNDSDVETETVPAGEPDPLFGFENMGTETLAAAESEKSSAASPTAPDLNPPAQPEAPSASAAPAAPAAPAAAAAPAAPAPGNPADAEVDAPYW